MKDVTEVNNAGSATATTLMTLLPALSTFTLLPKEEFVFSDSDSNTIGVVPTRVHRRMI